mgnify:CR=1 FL=1
MSTSAQNQSIENVSIPDVLNAGIPVLQRHDERQRDAGEQSDEKP